MRKFTKKRIIILVLAFTCVVVATSAMAMEGGDYQIPWTTGAGGSSGGGIRTPSGPGNYHLTDVIGQTATGSLSGTDYRLTAGFLSIMPLESNVKIYVELQGDERPPEGWEVPLTVCFCPEGSDDSALLNPGPEIHCFTGTSTAEWINGATRATITVEDVYRGTYDVTVDSSTTLLNVKRSVPVM